MGAVSGSGVEHPVEEPLSDRKLDDRTAIFSPPFRAFETDPDVIAVKTVL
jgi:hypothetical protein